jgi:uncharacterized membrane protein YdbT with pleckstrin-like domain
MEPERKIDDFRASTSRWLVGSFGGWGTLLLCLGLVGFLVIAVKWLQNISLRYVLTDQRLVMRQGIIMKREDDIELYRIKDIRVDYSIVNQLVGIGTITIRSSDATTAGSELQMRDIPQARRRREELRRLVDQARQSRGVREIDYDWETS